MVPLFYWLHVSFLPSDTKVTKFEHRALTKSDRQSDVAFQNLYIEVRPLARFPQLGDMGDAVAYRAAVRLGLRVMGRGMQTNSVRISLAVRLHLRVAVAA